MRNRRGNKLPVILTRDEVRCVLTNIRLLRHRACLTVIYACGLRLKEGTHLYVDQVDSKRMLIHIKGAKGNKDRYAPLPIKTLLLQRNHWKIHRNPVLVFPAPGRGGIRERTSNEPLPDGSVQTVNQ